jgi:ice-binding like protein
MKRNLIGPIVAVAAIAALMLSVAIGAIPDTAGAASRTNSTTAAGSLTSPPAVSCGQSLVPLGSAGNFRVLAGTTVTNTGATTVNGNLGVSPGSAVTGFPPGTVTGTIHKADKAAAAGQRDLVTAYNAAQARGTSCSVSVAGNLGGRTLGPGVYKSTSSLAISSGDLTLTAHGHPSAVFIFQTVTKLTVTSGRHVILAGGALASHVFWAVGSSATLGTTAVVYGVILAHKSISLATGATLHGRALANIGAVTLAGTTVAHVPFQSSTVSHPGATSTVARPFP